MPHAQPLSHGDSLLEGGLGLGKLASPEIEVAEPAPAERVGGVPVDSPEARIEGRRRIAE